MDIEEQLAKQVEGMSLFDLMVQLEPLLKAKDKHRQVIFDWDPERKLEFTVRVFYEVDDKAGKGRTVIEALENFVKNNQV